MVLVNSVSRVQSKVLFRSTELSVKPNTCVVLFDVDKFKMINDSYGHLYGDECLKSIAECIRKAFFSVGKCFRLGGDEFCMIAEASDPEVLQKALERFLQELAILRRSDSRLPMVSFGFAYAGQDDRDISALIQKADQNMYQYKDQREKKNLETSCSL